MTRLALSLVLLIGCSSNAQQTSDALVKDTLASSDAGVVDLVLDHGVDGSTGKQDISGDLPGSAVDALVVDGASDGAVIYSLDYYDEPNFNWPPRWRGETPADKWWYCDRVEAADNYNGGLIPCCVSPESCLPKRVWCSCDIVAKATGLSMYCNTTYDKCYPGP